ncbi:MAG TPA: restriction endonuclease subunit S, partial [Prolixibacteraceae bacterium]|nr:restriction endonuclease subunit S [Prolixibacteraceae bacterium]
SENFEDIGKTALLNDEIENLLLNSFCKGFRILDKRFFPKFLNYLFSADVNRKRLSVEARGFTRINLKIGKVNDLTMFAPTSPEEQTAIAAFLDFKLSKIDRFIRKKKQLVKLLNEQKAAIINQAVTKGISDGKDAMNRVSTKPSGIEWLGDIPEHWEVRKLKYVTEVLRGKFTPRPRNDPKYYDGDYPFIQTGNITSTGKYIETYSQTLNELGREVSKEFPINTVVMSVAANIADVAILNFKACFPDSVIGFYPFEETDTDFLFYQLKNLRNEFYKIAIKSTQYNLNVDRVKNVKVFIPSLTEQQQIVFHIETETSKLNQTICTIEKEITLVQEYKTALIAEAVTGKIDVRDYVIPQTEEIESDEEIEEELNMVAEDEVAYETNDMD